MQYMSQLLEKPSENKQPSPRLKLDYRQKLAKVDPSQHAAFWRACRFLKPHLPMVVLSVICAFFVGAATAGSISAMLPIINVLSNKGDSVQAWANRQVIERRIGARLSDNPDRIEIQRVDNTGTAKDAGLSTGYLLPTGADKARERLERMADPAVSEAQVTLRDGDVQREVRLPLEPVAWHMQVFRNLAYRLPSADHPIYTLEAIFSVLAAIAVFGNIVRFFQEYLSDKVAILTVNDIRRRLYDHILHVPMSHFSSSGVSDLTSRLASDTAGLQEGFKALLGQSIQEPIKVAFVMGIIIYMDPWMTLFVIAFAPIMAALIRKFGKKMRRHSRRALEGSSTMLAQIEATLAGARVVKANNAEPFERRRYTRIMDQLIGEAIKMSRIDAASAPIIESLTLLLVGCVLMVAGYRIFVSNDLKPQSFIVMMGSLAFIGESLRRCSKINNVLQKSNSAAARVFEVMDLPVERPRYLSTDVHEVVRPRIKLPNLSREVCFENVSFTYPGADAPAVSGVSLTVPAGKAVAVVGRNGCGKTTLLALLPRFYDAQQGRILIDGVDTRDVTLKSLRHQISIVTQDSVIFPGTIAQNIAYGIPNAMRDDIIESAKKAHAHDFIMAKPLGYDTMLGDLGGGLSGGQKQRICIARAIFRSTPILILDEATSQVDAESEELIQAAIEQVMHGRTTFVIAHRWATIRSADMIVVLDKGRLVGQGSHDSLMESCDAYRQLYERQIGGE
jgi:ATP-binding cassette, subfamily B, bacterial MsbA